MAITPQQFASLLQQSSLLPSEKKSLLMSLPRLHEKQIQKLGKILEDDVRAQEMIFNEATAKTSSLGLKMKIELEKL